MSLARSYCCSGVLSHLAVANTLCAIVSGVPPIDCVPRSNLSAPSL